MSKENLTDFTLSKKSYASFDALTLKQLLKDRLNEEGVFTDQIFEGSNISSIIDIIAYSYHTLLFYLNQSSNETLFTEASIYENMNRIVKLIDYKPIGYQTSLLPFKVSANANIDRNLYTLKRYSFFIVNGTYFSFKNDITFNKTLTVDEELKSFSEDNLLFQGRYFEYPPQRAIGEDFEIFTLLVKDNINNEPINIEDSSIDVYTFDVNSGLYTYYTETNNLFLENPTSPVYEKRLNENGFYEIKFGNGVFGKKLNAGDQIFIYYIKSDGEKGVIEANALNGKTVNYFTSVQFESISKDIYNDKNYEFLSPDKLQDLAFTNTIESTFPKEKESIEEIQQNAPKLFTAQDRLVTNEDFNSFLRKNFSNILDSYNVVNNKTFIQKYIQYFYDLGLDTPNEDPRFLFNQVKFSSSAELNNIYLFTVPKIRNVDEDNTLSFLTLSQKNSIINSLEDKKLVTMEIIPQDPVYMGFNLGLEKNNTEKISKDFIDDTFLVLKRKISERVSEESLKQQTDLIFKNYFKSLKLGETISLNDLKVSILSLNGVDRIFTRRIDPLDGTTLNETPNISLVGFNAIYSDLDIKIYSNDTVLEFFKYPFLFNGNIRNNIIVEDA
tara:strand:- start:1335 stop:3167 length:1833 start_codon:yes stop_codon:yes gene_type:complete